jgi:hypothetical protein
MARRSRKSRSGWWRSPAETASTAAPATAPAIAARRPRRLMRSPSYRPARS